MSVLIIYSICQSSAGFLASHLSLFDQKLQAIDGNFLFLQDRYEHISAPRSLGNDHTTTFYPVNGLQFKSNVGLQIPSKADLNADSRVSIPPVS